MANFKSKFVSGQTENSFFSGSQRKKTATGHALDANTVALWRMEADGTDETGNENLTVVTPTQVSSVDGAINNALSLITTFQSPIGQTSYLRGSGLSKTGSVNIYDALSQEFTIEMWALFGSGSYLIYAGDMNGSIEGFGDFAMMMRVYIEAGSIFFEWERQNSLAEPYHVVSASTSAVAPIGSWAHYAFRKKLNGGNFDCQIFINGQLASSDLNKPNWSSTYLNSTNLDFSIGFFKRPIDTNWASITATIDDTRLSNIARTDEEIYQSYLDGLEDY